MFNLPELERNILKFWQDQDIFKKSLEKENPKGLTFAKATVGKDFVFYDGPPFATGTPHYGHLVASLIKDIVPRYWTMKGYRVERKWGWDCHGLPIENIVEEEMKIKSKKEIEEIGIDKFNEACRSKVLIYAEEWRKVINRLGRFVDMDNSYRTMDKDFMESVWWVFRKLWNKGLIYEGYKSMHVCPRCETTLSQSEVSQGYKDIKDISIITKFELIASSGQSMASLGQDEGPIYILAWTTTPWTLPGNVALAMGKDVKYVLVESQPSLTFTLSEKKPSFNPPLGKGEITPPFPPLGKGGTKGGSEYYILAKQNLDSIFKGREYKIIGSIKAKDLEGKKYQPLFPYFLNKEIENKENLYTIQLADFVSVEDGTGVVHIAPAFGEDDMNLAKEKNLPFIQHVKMDGRFTLEVVDFANQEVKPKNAPNLTDKKIIRYLEKKNLVFKIEPFTHSYPHCWRCESPLLNYATSSWFVKVEAIKEKMLKNAKNINWVPSYLKEGRFGKWLEGAKDWSISRQRFWGSVLPIWRCQMSADSRGSSRLPKRGFNAEKENSGCGNMVVVGSVEELEKLSGQKVEDLHKHFVDKIIFKCRKCGGLMKRVPDVLDCWFESGSMPYAQMHYPFENKEKFEKNFPAYFIAEGVDQTRAWFYYLHVLSTSLKDSEAFKNVIANGIVLASDGKKMSKRLQNYPEPEEVFEKYGADAVRYYLATSPVMKAEDLCFSEKEVDKVVKKVLLILLNVLSFYKIYADQNADSLGRSNIDQISDRSISILDRWIISKIELLKKEITDAYNSYDLVKATRPLEGFINELSTWYLRRSRERFKSDNEKDKLNALQTTRYVLLELSKIMAPVMPFSADYLYQELGGEKESVHLEDWAEVSKKLIDQKILDYMEITRKIVELGLAKRAEAGLKVRQPLSKLKISAKGGSASGGKNEKPVLSEVEGLKVNDEYIDLIKDEVNVKKVVFKGGKGQEIEVELDTLITDELKKEGYLRELVRTINGRRKKMGLTVNNRIEIQYNTADKMLAEVFERYKEELLKETLADELRPTSEDLEKMKVGEVEVGLKIKNKG